MINIRAKVKGNNMAAMALEAISTVRSQAQRQLVDNMAHSRQLPKEDNMRQRSITNRAPMYQKGKDPSKLDM